MKSTLLFDPQKISYYCQELSFPGPEDTILHVRVWMPSHIESIEAASAVVLAVHGIYQSSHSFDFQAHLAMEGTVFIALDLPFHGATVTPDTLTFSSDLMSGSIRAVIEYLDLSVIPLFLMGWSFGGWCLGTYLQRYGVRGIQGLILVSALFGDIQQCLTYVEDYVSLETMSTLSDPSAAVSSALLATQEFVGMLRHGEYESIEEYAQVLGYNVRSVARMHTLDANPMDVVGQTPLVDLYERLNQTSLPVCMMTGRQDAVMPLEWFRWIGNHLTHVEMHEKEECGHSFFAEYPQEFNALVLNFVQSHLV